MVDRIDALTDEQRATFPAWVEKWTKVGHRTGRLTSQEWDTVRGAVRAAYGYAGLSEPRHIVLAPSPFAATMTVFITDELAKTGPGLGQSVLRAIRSAVSWGTSDAVALNARDGVLKATGKVVNAVGPVAGAVRRGVGGSANTASATGDGVRRAILEALMVSASAYEEVSESIDEEVASETAHKVRDPVIESTDAVYSGVARGVSDTPGGIGPGVSIDMRFLVGRAILDAISRTVLDATRSGVLRAHDYSDRSTHESVVTGVADTVKDLQDPGPGPGASMEFLRNIRWSVNQAINNAISGDAAGETSYGPLLDVSENVSDVVGAVDVAIRDTTPPGDGVEYLVNGAVFADVKRAVADALSEQMFMEVFGTRFMEATAPVDVGYAIGETDTAGHRDVSLQWAIRESLTITLETSNDCYAEVRESVLNQVNRAIRDVISLRVSSEAWGSAWRPMLDSRLGAVEAAPGDGVGHAVRHGLRDVVRDATFKSLGAPAWNDVLNDVREAVWNTGVETTGLTVAEEVRRSAGSVSTPGEGVGAIVSDALSLAVDETIVDSVAWGLRSEARLNMLEVSNSSLPSVLESGIRHAAESVHAVEHELNGAVTRAIERAKTDYYREWSGGNLWCDWEAWASWFRDVAHLELPGDLWDRAQTSIDLTLAGPQQWYRNMCVVSDRPTVLHLENNNGATRLHCPDGPAIAWADGWALHYWHGTRVPADMIEGPGWDTSRILREENTEVRRCAIEHYGWDKFVADAGLQQVGDIVPDPGNAGQTLSLWDVPERIYGDTDVRVLLCANGTPERDGTRRQFGLTVPATIDTPLEAAAWGYNFTPEVYATCQRRA